MEMEALSRVSWLQFSSSPSFGSRTNQHTLFPKPLVLTLRKRTISVLNTPSSAGERAEEGVLEEFFRDRQLHGDLITKYSDILFQRNVMRFNDAEASRVADNSQIQSTEEALVDEPVGGFLKLTKTQEWLLGGETSAPINRKTLNKALEDDRERRRQLNLLRYEALKRELLFMTVGVGAACTAYCLLTLSIQAAVSYASGVGFSCLYLQLLYQHADNISKESIPQIFMQKKQKKIGIRSDDLKDLVERSVKGSGIALSSPRLVIPAAIYGLWILLHRNFASDIFDFQIVPTMLGLFAYKAAALIQVYRDNEDLRFIFADDEESSGG